MTTPTDLDPFEYESVRRPATARHGGLTQNVTDADRAKAREILFERNIAIIPANKDYLVEVIAAALAAARAEERERLKNKIDLRLNNRLCEMKPDFDDSITGFNEAWEIVAATIRKGDAQ